MRTFMIVATTLLIAACASTGNQPAVPAPASAAPASASRAAAEPRTIASADGIKQVCFNERVTGSRQPKRVCISEEQYELRKEAGQDATRNVQRLPWSERGN